MIDDEQDTIPYNLEIPTKPSNHPPSEPPNIKPRKDIFYFVVAFSLGTVLTVLYMVAC